MTRDAWREFICSPRHAGRHLSVIGRGVAAGIFDAIEQETLRAFLDRLSNASDDVQLLGDAVDLITGGYLEFVTRPLSKVLDSLSNEMLRQEEVVGPGLRGNPRWDTTLIQRLSGRLSVNHYVSGTARRSFDLPENKLIAWLVRDLIRCIEAIERRIGTQSLHPSLQILHRMCSAANAHHWFSTIPVPISLEYGHLSSARGHRMPEYRKAAALAERRRSLESRDHQAWWYSVLALLAVNWLEPISDDDLFELYVLVLTLDVLSAELGFGEPTEFGLLIPGRKHVAAFEKEDRTLAVHFDQALAGIIRAPSAYGNVVRGYVGISGSERRPDIVIVAGAGEARRVVLIEAKRSSDGGYISDSIYKVFGYLYDFRSDIVPAKAILVIPSGVEQIEAPSADQQLLIVSVDARESFVRALRAALT